MSWSFGSTSEPSRDKAASTGAVRCDAVATTGDGARLELRRAGGPLGRARGLLDLPGLIEPTSGAPMALWLGRTPQVHTFGMTQPIAVFTAEASERGDHRRRPAAIRVLHVDELVPGKVGRWSWAAPITVELAASAVKQLKLGPGSTLAIHWSASDTGGTR